MLVWVTGDRVVDPWREEVHQSHCREARPVLVDADGPQHADEQLERGIDRRNRLVAAAAARAKRDPAEERDVLEPRQLVTALWAARAWTNNAQITRPSRDAHIEKRPDA